MKPFRFDQFEYDSDARTLVGPDGNLDLRPQVATALKYFLLHPGETVSKEELMDLLWPDTVVQEQNLTLCISELRRILNDDVKEPKFIKTLPKVGYRWVWDEPNTKAKKSPLIVLSVVVLALLSWVVFKQENQNTFPKQEHVRIAFWPFENQTGDEALKWIELGLMDMVAEMCRKSTKIEIVPAEKVLQAKTQFQALEGSTACEMLGADFVIKTVIAREGEQFRAQYSMCFRDGGEIQNVIEDSNLMEVANLVGRAVSQRVMPDEPIWELVDQFNTDPYLNITYASGLQTLLTDGPKRALPYFENCVQRDPNFLWAKFQLAKAYRILGKADESKKLLEELIVQAEERNNPLVQASALGVLSVLVMFSKWDIERSEQLVLEAQKLYEQEKEWMAAALCQGQLGYLQYAANDLESAEKNLKQCLLIARQQGDVLVEGQVLNTLSLVRDGYDDWDGINMYLNEALACFERVGNEPGIALIFGNLGTYSLRYGVWGDAQTYLSEGLKRYEEAGDGPGRLRMHLSYGLWFVSKNDVDSALDHLEKGIELAEAIGDQITGIQCKLLKLRILADLGEWDKVQIAELEAEVQGLEYDELTVLFYIAKAYGLAVLKNPEQARAAIQNVPQSGRETFEYKFVLGVLAFYEGDVSDAKSYFEQTQGLVFGEWKTFLKPYVASGTDGEGELPHPRFHLYD